MLHTFKKRLYFVVAAYFAFWATFVLKRWRPRVIVITGSSGKTTVLHLVEAQLGDEAVYSHHANSSIGLPFYILGMDSNVLNRKEWPKRFLLAPFKAFRSPPAQKLLIAEADCDRPHEGEFLAKLLKPEVVLWVSVSNTHSMNFDRLVTSGQFPTHVAAIAHEFGNYLAVASKLVMVNGDQPPMLAELKRVPKAVDIHEYTIKKIVSYTLSNTQTDFVIDNMHIKLPGLHPREIAVSLQMVEALMHYLDKPFDDNFTKLKMPPGRTNVLAGKKDTILIDSTYNTSVDAVSAVLDLFDQYPSRHKWLVLSDILEQGSLEQSEHEQLVSIIAKHQLEHIVLVGPRLQQYTFPLLKTALPKTPIVVFKDAGAGLAYLKINLTGGEAILFKGARGIEGIVEQLLANPADEKQLVRREPVWVRRRQNWGLPR